MQTCTLKNRILLLTTLREIKECLKKCSIITCSWIEKLNIVKMSVFFKLIHRFYAKLIKIPALFWVDIVNLILACGNVQGLEYPKQF